MESIKATTLDEAARLLLSQVRALQRMHRAGLQPHYGQLENLFDCTDVLDRQLNSSAPPPEAEPLICLTSECGKPAIGPCKFCQTCIGDRVAAALVKGVSFDHLSDYTLRR